MTAAGHSGRGDSLRLGAGGAAVAAADHGRVGSVSLAGWCLSPKLVSDEGRGLDSGAGDTEEAQSAVKTRLEMSSRSQSIPGSRSSPVTALQPWIRQWWLRMEARSRAWRQKGLVEPAGLSLSFPSHTMGDSSCTPPPLSDIKSTWAAECLPRARHFAGSRGHLSLAKAS